jgi:hypothetical protein
MGKTGELMSRDVPPAPRWILKCGTCNALCVRLSNPVFFVERGRIVIWTVILSGHSSRNRVAVTSEWTPDFG